MMRPQVFWPTTIFGGLLIGYIAVECFKPRLPNEVRREPETEVKKAADAQPHSSDAATPIPRTDLDPPALPFQATANPWQEKLSALIDGREELFGPAGEERLQELQDFVESIATADLPTVVRELQELQMRTTTVLGRELQSHLLRQWAEKDVRAATDWITQMPAGSDRQQAIAAIAGVWAGQSFTEAVTWARQLSDNNERQIALENLVEEKVYANPTEALELAATLSPSSTLDGTVERAIAAWTRIAPENAVLWAKQIPDEGAREQAMASIATAWGESNPVAAGHLASSLRPGPLQDRAVIAVVQRWVQSDAPGATAWVDQFPEGTLRQTAIAMLDKSTRYHRSVLYAP